MSKTQAPAKLARTCRQQAQLTTNPETRAVLLGMAEHYEKKALGIDSSNASLPNEALSS